MSSESKDDNLSALPDEWYRKMISSAKFISLVNAFPVAALNAGDDTNQFFRSPQNLEKWAQSLGNYSPYADVWRAWLRVAWLHTHTSPTFSGAMRIAYENRIINGDVWSFIDENSDSLNKMIVSDRDYNRTLFSIRTLVESYLLKLVGSGTQGIVTKRIIETPQFMFMRTAVFLHYDSENPKYALEIIHRMYDDLSLGNYAHGSPTFINSGKNKAQLASCFLLSAPDSTNQLGDMNKDVLLMSSQGGGIGVSMSHIRQGPIANLAYASGVRGWSAILSSIVSNVDQCGSRPGTAALYLNIWHIGIQNFLAGARDKTETALPQIMYAVVIPDLFMKRLTSGNMDATWALFNPAVVPELNDVYGKRFDELYEKFEAQALSKDEMASTKIVCSTVRVRDLWEDLLNTIKLSSKTFVMYSDAANEKSNQKNYGKIHCSNLCTEIMQVTKPGEIAATCNLASVCVADLFTNGGGGADVLSRVNFSELERRSRACVRNLNQTVDRTFYDDGLRKRVKDPNMLLRPLGIGISGLANLMAALEMPWMTPIDTSIQADEKFFDRSNLKLNPDVARVSQAVSECIFFSCISESCRMARERKETYPEFEGSPASQGLLQPDLWKLDPSKDFVWIRPELYAKLKHKVQTYGLYNSLLTTIMPTASTAHITGVNECVEPFTEGVYDRTNRASRHTIWAREFFPMLEKCFASGEMKMAPLDVSRELAAMRSEQRPMYLCSSIPRRVRLIFMGAHDMPQMELIKLFIGRGPFIDQSQSLNAYFRDGTLNDISRFLLAGWSGGLKTGVYYTHIPPKQPKSDEVMTEFGKESTNEKKEYSSSETKLAEGGIQGDACPIGCDSCST